MANMDGGSTKESFGFAENIRLNAIETYMKVRHGERPEFWSSSKGMPGIGHGDDEYHRPSVEWWRNHKDHKDPQWGFDAVLHAEFDRVTGKPNSVDDVLAGIQHVWDLIDTGFSRLMAIDSKEAIRLNEVMLKKLKELSAENKLPAKSGDALKLQQRRIQQMQKSYGQF